MCPVPLHSSGALACRPYRWRLGEELYLGVAAKASFAMVPDGQARLDAPKMLRRQAASHPLNPTLGIVAPADEIPYRPHADVTCWAKAYGGSERHLRLVVRRGQQAAIDKHLVVRAANAEPIDVNWSLSARGPDNPHAVSSVGSVIDPARPDTPSSFLPIPSFVPARKRLLGGGLAPKWRGDEFSVSRPIDWAYFQCASADQTMAYLQGDEVLLLEGMHPVHRQLSTCLPGLSAHAFLAHTAKGQWEPLTLVADGCFIQPDELSVEVTWRGSVRIHDESALEDMRLLVDVARNADEVRLVPVDQVTQMVAPPSSAKASVGGTIGLAPCAHAAAVSAAKAANPFERDAAAAGRMTLSPQHTEPSEVAPYALATPGPRAVSPIPGAPWGDALPATQDPIEAMTLDGTASLDEVLGRTKDDERAPAADEAPAPVDAVARPGEVEAPEIIIRAEPAPPQDGSQAEVAAPEGPAAPAGPKPPARKVPDVAKKLYGGFG